MSEKHLIISSDNITRQLLSGILRKMGADFTDEYQLDENIKNSNANIFIIDLGEDLYKAEIIWENANNYGIANKSVFAIDASNPLLDTIKQHIDEIRIITKPIIPDKIFAALENLSTIQPQTDIVDTDIPVNTVAPEIAEEKTANSREDFMRKAIDLSFKKMREEHTAPFAAVIVKNNKIIAEGWSQVIAEHDPTAHAEIVALRKAGKVLEYHKLNDCEIYTTTEPCPMCLAALYMAGIQKIYYANSQDDAEEFGFGTKNIYDEIAMQREKRIMPYIKLLEDEAIYALEEWNKNFTEDGYDIVE